MSILKHSLLAMNKRVAVNMNLYSGNSTGFTKKKGAYSMIFLKAEMPATKLLPLIDKFFHFMLIFLLIYHITNGNIEI